MQSWKLAHLVLLDDNYGEEISACVFLKEDLDTNEKELKDLCKADLGEYKTPSQIIFVDKPLPKGPSGKIQRLKIASLYNRSLAKPGIYRGK